MDKSREDSPLEEKSGQVKRGLATRQQVKLKRKRERETMDDIKEGGTSIQVIIFDGSKSNWEIWKEQFYAQAVQQGYIRELTGENPIPKKEEEVDEEKSRDEFEKSKQRNAIGYTDLILSMDTTKKGGKIAFACIKRSKSKEYPEGNIAVAWENLKKKYEPNTRPQLIILENEYHNLKMKKGEDPDSFITNLKFMAARLEELGHEISKNSMVV